jgi:tetratricopeptide (TPR) repeat protein
MFWAVFALAWLPCGNDVAVTNVANEYLRGGRLVEAARVYECAMRAETPELVTVLTNYGAVCRRLGRYADAESLHRRALQFARSAGAGPRPIAQIQVNLARTLLDERKFAESEELYRQAAKAIPEAAVSLGELYAMSGRRREAEAAFRGHLKSATVERDAATLGLGRLLRDERRWREAENTLQTAIEMASTAQLRSTALNACGAMWYSRRRYADAADAFRKAARVDAGAEMLGVSLINLGNALEALKRRDEAAAVYRSALQANERAYGADSPALACNLYAAGLFFVSVKRVGEATPLLLRAAEIWSRDRTGSDLTIATKLQTIVGVLRRSELYAEAAGLEARVTGIQVRHGLLK